MYIYFLLLTTMFFSFFLHDLSSFAECSTAQPSLAQIAIGWILYYNHNNMQLTMKTTTTTTSATIYSSVYNPSVVSKLRNVKRTRKQFKDIALRCMGIMLIQNTTYRESITRKRFFNDGRMKMKESQTSSLLCSVVSDVRIVTY